MLELVNGWMALGAMGGAIPVIIHLLNRRRFKITRWAAMDFLLASLQKNYKRLRMENLLLLLLRALIIILVALALARPRLSESGIAAALGVESRHAIIILDDSYSMSCRHGSETSFARAQAVAQQILGSFNNGDVISLLAMSDVTRPIIKEPTLDIDLVRREVARAEPGWGGTDVQRALAAAADLFSSTRKPHKEIFLITDMQALGWGRKAEEPSAEFKAALDRIGKEAKLFVVDAGSPGTETAAENLAVTALTPLSRLTGTGSLAELKVEVTNFGRSPRTGVELRLIVDQFNQDAVTIEVPPGKTEAATFMHTFHAKGSHLLAVELSDEKLRADNTRYLALNVVESVPALLVNGETSPEIDENETYYLERALRPPSEAGGVRISNIEPTTITEFGLSGADFTRYRLVVLANLPSLSAQNTLARLEEYVRQGGSLLVFLGDRIDTAFYNEHLFRDGAGLLPARIGAQLGSLGEGRKGTNIELVSPVHPAFERFTGESAFHITQKILFHKYFDLKLPQKTEDIRVAAKFADGGPAILEKAFGRGRVMLFASSADAEWTNFPKSAAYPVVVHDLMSHMASGDLEQRNLLVHQAYRRTFSPEELVDSVTVRPPGQAGAERKLRPHQPKAPPQKAGSNEAETSVLAEIEFGETDTAGGYTLELETKDGHTLPGECFAVNVPPEEGDLTRCGQDDIKKRLGNLEFKYATGADDLRLAVRQSRTGREFSRALLLTVLAMACVELVLGHRFSR